MVQVLPDDAPAPRLCHLIKWPDFDGYGFNLHAERSNPGQFIGKIDDDSPAQMAGLREGDRIVEVNGVNIANENHRQVVERIKSNPLEARLLVVDQVADLWYREQDLIVKSTQLNVIYMKTPVPRPRHTSDEHETATPSTSDFNDDSIEQQVAPGEPKQGTRTPAPMSPDSGPGHDEVEAQLIAGEQVAATAAPAAAAAAAASSELVVEAEINQQAPISELSKMHKQLVVNEVKQRLTKQQDESVPIQADSLASEHAKADEQQDQEQARAKHNGSADSGKPTDSTRSSSSSSSASIADSLEEHEQQQTTKTISNAVETQPVSAPQESTTLDVEQKQKQDNSTSTEAQQTQPTPNSELKQSESGAAKAAQTKQPVVAEAEQATRLSSGAVKWPAEDKTTEIGAMTHATSAPAAAKDADAPLLAKSPVTPLQTSANNNQMPQNNNNNYSSGLNLNMTASQMRELIASRKKFDPKKAQMNIRQKYEIIQQM